MQLQKLRQHGAGICGAGAVGQEARCGIRKDSGAADLAQWRGRSRTTITEPKEKRNKIIQ